MPLDPKYNQLNRESTERIKKLAASLTDEQMQTKVGEHWTVAIALVHLAFWDRRVLATLEETAKNKKLSVIEVETVVNDLSLPIWETVPAKDAVKLAIETAEKLDNQLENFPKDLLEKMYHHNKRLVVRALHRNEHLDEVEEALKN
ncbi:MAG: maleylpyruvate isomerase N-terminal domain-containing protein [Anaerolineales bacterium]|nr:maleylpyruvate isomerase N-terminal domain-containing protein [Anaerolineales bacterium]